MFIIKFTFYFLYCIIIMYLFERGEIMEIKNVIRTLRNKGYKVFYTNTVVETNSLLLELIKGSDSIGFGGSATLDEIGIGDSLQARGNRVYCTRLMPNADPNEVKRKGIMADWYLTSTNALTEQGEFVNTDGNCNRIAGQVFGGANTVIVLGVNKIVPTIQDAFQRINKEAARLNCLRLGLHNNPCVTGGSCKDCPIETNICCATTIIHVPPRQKNMYVIIVNKELGF